MLALYIAALAALFAPARDVTTFANAVGRAASNVAPLFKDDVDRKKTVSLLTAIGYRESSFRMNAVSATNDYCYFQVHGRPELAEDPDACARVAIEMLRESMRACPEHPVAFYASGPGGCTNLRAQRISRDRMSLAAWAARQVRP